MARAPTASKAPSASKAVATTAPRQSLTAIDEQLRQEALALKDQLPTGGGVRIKLDNKKSTFTSPSGEDLGDTLQIVVVDYLAWNRYYESSYEKDNPTLPVCFAHDKAVKSLTPSPNGSHIQNDGPCNTCKWDQFKTAKVGKGKACKNSRDIAVLLVDPNNPDAISDPKAPIYIFSVPPTGIQSFDGFALGVGRSLGGPPVKAIVTMQAMDMGQYSSISFSDPVPNPDYGMHVGRRAEIADILAREPDYESFESAKPQTAARKPSGARNAGKATPARR